LVSDETLADWVDDARERSLEIVADLSDERMMGPRLAIVNPLLWEIGHGAWFQERWVLRQGGEPEVTGVHGVRALAIMRAMLRSHAERRLVSLEEILEND
jgi:hypothetical protein